VGNWGGGGGGGGGGVLGGCALPLILIPCMAPFNAAFRINLDTISDPNINRKGVRGPLNKDHRNMLVYPIDPFKMKA
jgi:hypothetical protein